MKGAGGAAVCSALCVCVCTFGRGDGGGERRPGAGRLVDGSRGGQREVLAVGSHSTLKEGHKSD